MRAVGIVVALHVLLLGAALAAGSMDTSPRRQLAYYVHRMGAGRILLTDVDRLLTAPLLRHDTYIVSQDWSPDGERLTFIAYDNMGIFRVYLLDLDSRRLTVIDRQNSSNEALHWSPAGGWIAFNSYIGPRPTIFLIDPDTLNVQPLSPTGILWNSEPSWSPDGTRLAFSGRGDSLDIFIADPNCLAQGCAPSLLIDHPAADRQPAWSPDGTRMAFVSDRAGRSAIYIVDADCAACADAPLHVADLSMISTGMNWSPDGTLLAYTAAPRGVGSAVYLADVSCADCPPTIHALSQPQHVDSSPVWSPDGRMLAFVSRFLNVGDIAIMDVDCIHQPAGCAGARRLLTQHNVDVWSAAWRPG